MIPKVTHLGHVALVAKKMVLDIGLLAGPGLLPDARFTPKITPGLYRNYAAGPLYTALIIYGEFEGRSPS